MKAKLIFNLPEDQHAFNMANRARDYYLVLCDLDNHLRNTMKHAALTEDEYKAMEATREKLTELLNDYNITLE